MSSCESSANTLFIFLHTVHCIMKLQKLRWVGGRGKGVGGREGDGLVCGRGKKGWQQQTSADVLHLSITTPNPCTSTHSWSEASVLLAASTRLGLVLPNMSIDACKVGLSLISKGISNGPQQVDASISCCMTAVVEQSDCRARALNTRNRYPWPQHSSQMDRRTYVCTQHTHTRVAMRSHMYTWGHMAERGTVCELGWKSDFRATAL